MLGSELTLGCYPFCTVVGSTVAAPGDFGCGFLLMVKTTRCLASSEEAPAGTPLHLLGEVGGKLLVGKLLQIINFENRQPSLLSSQKGFSVSTNRVEHP